MSDPSVVIIPSQAGILMIVHLILAGKGFDELYLSYDIFIRIGYANIANLPSV